MSKGMVVQEKQMEIVLIFSYLGILNLYHFTMQLMKIIENYRFWNFKDVRLDICNVR